MIIFETCQTQKHSSGFIFIITSLAGSRDCFCWKLIEL